MDQRQQQQRGLQGLVLGLPRMGDAIQFTHLQKQADALGSAVEANVARIKQNWERRQLRMRYGRSTGRVQMSSGRFAAVIPGDSVVEAVITTGISSFLNLYNVALIGRLILTWFPSPPEAIVAPLAYLNLFRGIIPPLGGTIDLSPILAFITLDLFVNATAALPCEVGPDGQRKESAKRAFAFRGLNPTPAMLAWQKRRAATEQRRQGTAPQ